MTEQQIVNLLLSDNGKNIIILIITAWFVKRFLPDMISYIMKKASQTVKNFFKSIEELKTIQEDIKNKQIEMEKKVQSGLLKRQESKESIDELKNRLDGHIEETTEKLNDIGIAIKSIKGHEQTNSDAVLKELKELNANFDKNGEI